MAQSRRRPARGGVVVERCGDVQREADRGAADGRLDLAISCLRTEHEPGLKACPDAAALIDAAQGVARLPQARRHALNLPAKPAHREENAPSHLTTEGLREDETHARDVDLQSRSGGMVPELPLRLSAV
jgi:hypothetical protein